MTAGWMLRAVLVVSLLTASGCAMRSTTGAYLHESAPPSSAEERRELCASYSNRLETTRAQMRRRNAFGRLDLLRAEHRAMERYVDTYCS